MSENRNAPPFHDIPPDTVAPDTVTPDAGRPEDRASAAAPAGRSGGRGFAAMDPERQREIARKGGRSVPDEKRSFSQNRELAAAAGRKGGQESGGNFAHNRERAAAAGRKGGQH
jgi:general stress protein YciG